jgi:hypothetical protein
MKAAYVKEDDTRYSPLLTGGFETFGRGDYSTYNTLLTTDFASYNR